jgi:hypothetical protein
MMACSNPAPATASCVTVQPATCSPLYDPTFDQIFTRTLHTTCAQEGGACHSASGAQGGLVYEDADAAYALLLGKTDGRARVVPGDPSCSILIERVDAPDPSQTMPPGAELSAAERCSFETWIRNGAKR